MWNDPHVGGDHGFVEFVRVVDDEATLLVTAADGGSARAGSRLEAWRPMLEDLGDGDSYEWVVASAAWAAEWAQNTQWPYLKMSDSLKTLYPPFATDPQTPWPATDGKRSMPLLTADGGGAASPWNPPTSLTLAPGETHSVALRLQLATGGPRTRDAALSSMGGAVLRAVPGYVLSRRRPLSSRRRAASAPRAPSTATLTVSVGPSAGGGFERLDLSAVGYGKSRVVVTFSDGSTAVAHYNILPPFATQVAALGTHLADVAWLPREYPDPFGRSASVMPWDRSICAESGEPCGHVINDARAYDSGLSDDAGGGNPLGFASKVRAAPTQHEASRIDEYIQWTLYGVKPDTAKPPLKSLQIREDEEGDVDGIRMTMFYYNCSSGRTCSATTSGHFDWDYTEADKCPMPFGGPTWCMTENMANATYRGFNVPHQTASYWAMYTVARFTALKTRMPWHWYLYRAGKTCLKLGQAGVGFMDGTVAREVLDALLVEGFAGNSTLLGIANTLKANMQVRQKRWADTPYPYGSEFGFDTTGQEEVVVWNLYFGNESAAKKTVDHVLSYMRNSPTWAYHGGARSLGDIGNNGKYLATFGTSVADRGNMHYRSGLNMIPLIEWYRRHPEEGTFLLEVAMGAISGQMANIDPRTGATSMMMHMVAHSLAYDPHSGDFGLGFFGNALESGAYYVEDPTLGPLCFLCEMGGGGVLTAKDAYRRAFYVEPLGLYLQTECGEIAAVTYVGATAPLTVAFGGDYGLCPKLRLKLSKPGLTKPGANFSVVGATKVRGAYELAPPSSGVATMTVTHGGVRAAA